MPLHKEDIKDDSRASVVSFIVRNSENFTVKGVHGTSGPFKLHDISSCSTTGAKGGIDILTSKTNGIKVIEVSDVKREPNYSRAIEIRKNSGSRGRPVIRKVIEDCKPNRWKKRKRRKVVKRENYEELKDAANLNLTDDGFLDDIESRKRNIRAKLCAKKEHLLTPDEEQDIHARAEMYAITANPDAQFFILPENDTQPQNTVQTEEIHADSSFPVMRKRRRRNYGSSSCYITMHKYDDYYDNTKMLPIGTRLSKPSTKLVELVAMAIDGSPDGLLQVQQIYTFLQNKYPYFRYIERAVINSWRSSIRHALYQKWFRKIRFNVATINCKGCYWAINHKSNPKEWTMPLTSTNLDTEEDDLLLEDLEMIQMNMADSVCALLQQEQDEDTHRVEDVVAIARQYGVTASIFSQQSEDEDQEERHAPSPVREPDPILAVCAPDWQVCPGSDETYFVTMTTDDNDCSIHQSYSSSNSSSGSCDLIGSSLCPSHCLPANEELETLQLDASLPSSYPPERSVVSPLTPVLPDNAELNSANNRPRTREEIGLSPLVNWTPNWEEYGTYLTSPSGPAPSMYILGSEEKTDSALRNDQQFREDNAASPQDDQLNSSPAIEGDFVDSIENYYKEMTVISDSSSIEDFEILGEIPKQIDLTASMTGDSFLSGHHQGDCATSAFLSVW